MVIYLERKISNSLFQKNIIKNNLQIINYINKNLEKYDYILVSKLFHL